MTIGEVLSELSRDFPDVSISKIRFLEGEGLIRPQRAPSGYRRFTGEDLATLLPRSRVDAVRRDLVAWDIDLFESVRDAGGV